MPTIAPFPFHHLPRVAARDVALARAITRRLAPRRTAPAARTFLPRALATLLADRVTARPGIPVVIEARRLASVLPQPLVAPVVSHAALGVVAVVIDAVVAREMAARALGEDPGEAFSHEHEGALAMLAGACAAYVCEPSALPVVRGVADNQDDLYEALGTGEMVSWPWHLALDDLAATVTLLVPARALLRTATPVVEPLPDSLSPIGVAVDLLIARDRIDARSVASWVVGDVLAFGPEVTVDERGSPRGPMVLALGAVRLAVDVEGGRVVLAARPVAMAGTPDDPMSHASDEHESDDGSHEPPVVRTEQLATLPVDVDVVIAHATHAIGDVAAWRIGEVVTFATPIGSAVVVRAGGRPVARGELCTVDGEVGVKLTELL